VKFEGEDQKWRAAEAAAPAVANAAVDAKEKFISTMMGTQEEEEEQEEEEDDEHPYGDDFSMLLAALLKWSRLTETSAQDDEVMQVVWLNASAAQISGAITLLSDELDESDPRVLAACALLRGLLSR